MTNSAPTAPRLAPIALTVVGFFALWIGWVLALLQFPDAFNGDGIGKGSLRACIRLVLWVGPVILYAWYAQQCSLLQFLALRTNWRKGLIGIVLGVSMKTTGSLLTPLIDHWANNIASIVVK